jgi:dimethylargininase
VKIAITRQVSASINQCELTHLGRQPIALERARLQHAQYEQVLQALGVEVRQLPALDEQPDAVFVEDVALVLDECAILTNPGAESRRPEVASIEEALAPFREIYTILPPGTLDGGDVLRVGNTLYVGLSGRSNQPGFEQLNLVLEAVNLKHNSSYNIRTIQVSGCLHLKSAVTQVQEDTLLINPAWVREDAFPDMRFIQVDPSEPYAANALWVEGSVIYPASFPRTGARLAEAGIDVVLVEADELGKAEGALTCCSLIFDV